MKVVYIDSQNIHKAIEELWWIIDWELFYEYMIKKFEVEEIKIFFWYMKKYDSFYTRLEQIWYKVIHKETLVLWNWTIKWNVDIDIAIQVMLDIFEWWLQKVYLVTWDWDYNTLVDLLKSRQLLWRVLIPNRKKASKLLKKSAWPDIQVLEDIRYFIEKTKSSEK